MVSEKLTEGQADALLWSCDFEKMIESAWYLIMVPWIWTTKQCFKKDEWKQLMYIQDRIQSL
jgi:hypothetical protein